MNTIIESTHLLKICTKDEAKEILSKKDLSSLDEKYKKVTDLNTLSKEELKEYFLWFSGRHLNETNFEVTDPYYKVKLLSSILIHITHKEDFDYSFEELKREVIAIFLEKCVRYLMAKDHLDITEFLVKLNNISSCEREINYNISSMLYQKVGIYCKDGCVIDKEEVKKILTIDKIQNIIENDFECDHLFNHSCNDNCICDFDDISLLTTKLNLRKHLEDLDDYVGEFLSKNVVIIMTENF